MFPAGITLTGSEARQPGKPCFQFQFLLKEQKVKENKMMKAVKAFLPEQFSQILVRIPGSVHTRGRRSQRSMACYCGGLQPGRIPRSAWLCDWAGTQMSTIGSMARCGTSYCRRCGEDRATMQQHI